MQKGKEMTDKQIIIDGVDISKCKHYDEVFNYCDQSYLGEGGLLKNTKNPKRCGCSPNCYYKQLKRKEQECEELKETIDGLLKIQYQLADSCNKYVQTLTKIKEIAEKSYDGFGNDVYGINPQQMKLEQNLGNLLFIVIVKDYIFLKQVNNMKK